MSNDFKTLYKLLRTDVKYKSSIKPKKYQKINYEKCPTKYNIKTWIRGKDSEEEFKEIMTREGYKVYKSSKYDDIYKHIDFYVVDPKTGNTTMSIDVKTMKKIKGEFQTDYCWCELVGPTGYPGWVYGKASHFGFKMQEGFLIIKKSDLIEIIENEYKNCNKITNSQNVLLENTREYCYRRNNEKYEKCILVDFHLLHKKGIMKA